MLKQKNTLLATLVLGTVSAICLSAQGNAVNPAGGAGQSKGTINNPSGAAKSQGTVTNPTGTQTQGTVNNPSGTLSADEKARLFDQLSENDQLATMRGIGKSVGSADSTTYLHGLTSADKAAAYDRLPSAQQMKLRNPAQNQGLVPSRPLITGDPNDPNIKDGATPSQSRPGTQPNNNNAAPIAPNSGAVTAPK